MTEKRFELSKSDIKDFRIYDYAKEDAYFIDCDKHTGSCLVSLLNQLNDENEQLKQGMIGVVDRYIKNVECNPPSSARTYGKIKGALINIREDLRNLIGDLE